MARTSFSADEFGLAVDAAQQASLQHPGCAIHLATVIRVHPLGEMRKPEISGYRISDWFDDSVAYTFVDGKTMNQ